MPLPQRAASPKTHTAACACACVRARVCAPQRVCGGFGWGAAYILGMHTKTYCPALYSKSAPKRTVATACAAAGVCPEEPRACALYGMQRAWPETAAAADGIVRATERRRNSMRTSTRVTEPEVRPYVHASHARAVTLKHRARHSRTILRVVFHERDARNVSRVRRHPCLAGVAHRGHVCVTHCIGQCSRGTLPRRSRPHALSSVIVGGAGSEWGELEMS